jgi:hypothetical protein
LKSRALKAAGTISCRISAAEGRNSYSMRGPVSTGRVSPPILPMGSSVSSTGVCRDDESNRM